MDILGLRHTSGNASGFMEGQILVAMPTMEDERFAKTVIYLCAHSPDGAMGIILNKPAPHIDFTELLTQLDILPEEQRIALPRAEAVRIVKGGPVETGRGFVLHTADYAAEHSTITITDGICLTATLDILKAIAVGRGPDQAVLALGYAGWAAGQLESEIQQNGWLNCPPDADLIFDGDAGSKYDRAMAKIGVVPSMLSGEAGHA